ncbi:MAG: patatin-like phospholipase family protein [Acidobacteriota bacterium]
MPPSTPFPASSQKSLTESFTESSPETLRSPSPPDLAVVLSGGGARGAYQVGVLRGIARRFPRLRFPIVTGVSAGAINAAFLASHPGSVEEATEELTQLWRNLEVKHVFRTHTSSMAASMMRWALRLSSGGSALAPTTRGLLDTAPLHQLLKRAIPTVDGVMEGVRRNHQQGKLRALALTTIDWNSGCTVTWVEGEEISTWERPNRVGRRCRMTLEHVMASSALPLVFPATRLAGSWHGDGGIRLSAPLSPAIHLGARRILVISNRYQRSAEEAQAPVILGYPPPAQIIGKLLNSIFLDLVDQDVARLTNINQLVARVPPEHRGRFRLLDTLVIRPSRDLGRLAADFEAQLPGTLRFITRSLGTRETSSPDFLSLLLFEPGYLRRLMEIGEEDAETALEPLTELLESGPSAPVNSAANTGATGRANPVDEKEPSSGDEPPLEEHSEDDHKRERAASAGDD